MPGEGNLGDVKFILRNGVKMPAVGLGTFRIRNSEVLYRTVDYALEAGYRLFDTAAVYQNELFLGYALRKLLPKHGLTREDVFITTKLAPADLSGDRVADAFKKSSDNIGLDYIDLYLIHFPGAANINAQNPKNAVLRVEAWKEIIKLYDQGKAKAIGVSNFTIKHLTELAEATDVEPMVNQIEWHPHYYQDDMLQYCESHNIRIQAYCSFGGLAVSNNTLMEESIVREIYGKYKATPAQVLLAWSLQRGVAVIPKSLTPHRIKSNIQINFRLSQEDLVRLDSLGKANIKYAWDPHNIA
ncbi:uncharacterized oxidoreductase YtbE-like isoform X1 [Nymphalis io]|uniref:uncharacterized oxidoreductase YtbE-like isoform X1 n=1 Tax=Inachis io TaxID=171585 RepID=UPI0021691466|nr:uncharacterized oxidoreductase YtbE-like isoform X1 [Nymphalis io]XP_050348468.1 uncharacterized oxidoreductase YtbE-like isoform X1 [Nymphalis io]